MILIGEARPLRKNIMVLRIHPLSALGRILLSRGHGEDVDFRVMRNTATAREREREPIILSQAARQQPRYIASSFHESRAQIVHGVGIYNDEKPWNLISRNFYNVFGRA